MHPKFQIFISSTYLDLKEERRHAAKAIIELGHFTAGMELFVANNGMLLETIYKWIEDSDLIIFIQGVRYGTIGTENEYSYTETEFRYAQNLKKPIFLILLHREEINRRLSDPETIKWIEGDNREKYEAFSSFLQNMDAAKSYYSNPTDVDFKIAQIIRDIERDKKISGWIQSDNSKLNLLRKPAYERRSFFKSKKIAGWNPFDDDIHYNISNKTFILIEIFKVIKSLTFVFYFQYQDDKQNLRWVGFSNFSSNNIKERGHIETTRQIIDEDSFIHTITINVFEEISLAFPDVKNNPENIKKVRFRGDGNHANEIIEFNYKIIEDNT